MSALSASPLGSPPWQTADPFLFCVHHVDGYPAGNEQMGPATTLAGRNIGMDFAGKDGWSMYHGDVVPGFPRHPHRGFETITIARRGYIDHSDSLGATARFGQGDVQWMTAGKGICHSEMFPLIERSDDNPVELFQIWLNLPSQDKLVEPHFKMLWSNTIPNVSHRDDSGRTTHVTVVAGRLGDAIAPSPAPKSWASRADAHVSIWIVEMQPNARWTLPAAASSASRRLYFYRGAHLEVAGAQQASGVVITVQPDADVELVNGPEPAELLLLQGRPIGEPIAHHGPFVMNTSAQLRQAFVDYQLTQFGGWPWDRDDPVHPRDQGRFARHADGHSERPESRD